MSTAKKPSALKGLRRKVRKLSERCSDLLQADLDDARASCFRRHCERVWEQMEAEDREAIRAEIIAQSTLLDKDSSRQHVEFYCVDAIKKELGEAVSHELDAGARR